MKRSTYSLESVIMHNWKCPECGELCRSDGNPAIHHIRGVCKRCDTVVEFTYRVGEMGYLK